MQNFLCRACAKQFQWEYFYQGANPLVKAQVKIGPPMRFFASW
ncbi:hypothetical protein [Emticicia sp. SJ17W-69]